MKWSNICEEGIKALGRRKDGTDIRVGGGLG